MGGRQTNKGCCLLLQNIQTCDVKSVYHALPFVRISQYISASYSCRGTTPNHAQSCNDHKQLSEVIGRSALLPKKD